VRRTRSRPIIPFPHSITPSTAHHFPSPNNLLLLPIDTPSSSPDPFDLLEHFPSFAVVVQAASLELPCVMPAIDDAVSSTPRRPRTTRSDQIEGVDSAEARDDGGERRSGGRRADTANSAPPDAWVFNKKSDGRCKSRFVVNALLELLDSPNSFPPSATLPSEPPTSPHPMRILLYLNSTSRSPVTSTSSSINPALAAFTRASIPVPTSSPTSTLPSSRSAMAGFQLELMDLAVQPGRSWLNERLMSQSRLRGLVFPEGTASNMVRREGDEPVWNESVRLTYDFRRGTGTET
jgi:hypothetical protein